jgi:hypothetical protein
MEVKVTVYGSFKNQIYSMYSNVLTQYQNRNFAKAGKAV